MTRKAVTFLSILTLALGAASAGFGADRGGAIPNGFSFYEANEFPDVQWAAAGAETAEGAWGSLVMEGTAGVRFVPDSGSPVTVPYTAISGIKYERVVVKKETPKNAKWHRRALAFAKGVDTYRTVTIEHNANGTRQSSVMRVDEASYASILRLLEIKTGLRAKKLSAF